MAKSLFEELGGKYKRQAQRLSCRCRQAGTETFPQAHRGHETGTGHNRRLKEENALEWVQCLNNIRACAGEIVEAVSGVSYSEYMNKNIFLPLHMEHTAATLEQSKENGLIRGYRNYFGFPIAGEPDYPDKHSWSTVSAGYLSSSVSDMAKYLQMYLNGGMGHILRY